MFVCCFFFKKQVKLKGIYIILTKLYNAFCLTISTVCYYYRFSDFFLIIQKGACVRPQFIHKHLSDVKTKNKKQKL